MYLEIELNHKVIAEASSGEEFLKLQNIAEAEVILMDINMGAINGLEATQLILREFHHLKIIAVTFDIQNSFLRRIIESGFKGFVNKTDVYKMLNSTLEDVYNGK
ncbi:response regulator transcription factor, partial [Desulfonatronum sp. SC1]|uniref:response regulator n=1 Tax=Desulfonatronum sp. SC1 TaxID=2109626 RepID=UPI001E456FDB